MSNFKRTTKTVRFEIPEETYNFFSDFISKVLKPKNPLTVDYLLRAFAINRAIDRGLLDEFGEPNYYVIPPELDLSKIDTEGISISTLRDITSGNSDKYIKEFPF